MHVSLKVVGEREMFWMEGILKDACATAGLLGNSSSWEQVMW